MSGHEVVVGSSYAGGSIRSHDFWPMICWMVFTTMVDVVVIDGRLLRPNQNHRGVGFYFCVHVIEIVIYFFQFFRFLRIALKMNACSLVLISRLKTPLVIIRGCPSSRKCDWSCIRDLGQLFLRYPIKSNSSHMFISSERRSKCDQLELTHWYKCGKTSRVAVGFLREILVFFSDEDQILMANKQAKGYRYCLVSLFVVQLPIEFLRLDRNCHVSIRKGSHFFEDCTDARLVSRIGDMVCLD